MPAHLHSVEFHPSTSTDHHNSRDQNADRHRRFLGHPLQLSFRLPAHVSIPFPLLWCSRRDSNSHAFQQPLLRRTRIPIPARELIVASAISRQIVSAYTVGSLYRRRSEICPTTTSKQILTNTSFLHVRSDPLKLTGPCCGRRFRAACSPIKPCSAISLLGGMASSFSLPFVSASSPAIYGALRQHPCLLIPPPAVAKGRKPQYRRSRGFFINSKH